MGGYGPCTEQAAERERKMDADATYVHLFDWLKIGQGFSLANQTS